MDRMMLLLFGTKTLAFTLKLLELIIRLLLRLVFRSNATIKFELKNVVIIIGNATNITLKNVSRKFLRDGVFDLFAIESCSFSFECVEGVFMVDELRWIDFHLLLDARFHLRLNVSHCLFEFHLKTRTRQSIAEIAKNLLTLMSHSMIVTALPGFVSCTHNS